MMEINITTLLFAFIGGVLPALIWLLFWINEDNDHPEPPRRIFFTFLYGMIAVATAIGLQWIIHTFFFQELNTATIVKQSLLTGTIAIIAASFIEEVVKYIAAYFGGIHTLDADEAVDVLIYMIAAALGFAAFENVLYIFDSLIQTNTVTAIVTGNLRFIGATLLHVGTSAVIGFFIAFSLFKNQKIRTFYTWIGLITATLLHALFNLLIIVYEKHTLFIFAGVWIGLLISLFIFEKIKHIHLNRIQ